jgi:hypothetical protein
MKEFAATVTFAAIGLFTLILGGIAVKRASSRPPRALLGAGIAALVLAAAYVTIASLLRTSQKIGLWAPSLATSVPTALSAAGTTAVSVWVALWAADQSRVAKFIGDEAALIRELDGALRLLERRSIWLKDFWLGSSSPAVIAGEELLTKFRAGEVDQMLESYDLFGSSGIAQEVVERLFAGLPDRTILDYSEALSDATRRLVALEIQTGLPMQPLLGDVEFLGVVTSYLNEGRSLDAGVNMESRQEETRAKRLLRLQLLVVLATCYSHASQGEGDRNSAESVVKILISSQGQWWQGIFSDLSERPPRVAMTLRQRYGRAPLTGYEAIKAVPAEELREADRLWRLFILAPFRRSDVLDAISVLDPERARPRSFSNLSHMMFWQRVREAAHLDDGLSN